MDRANVSVVKYTDRSSVRQAIELCGGLDALKPGDSVLLKPNLVVWDTVYPFAPYGVVTTTLVLEEVVRLLKEAGVQQITIGEAGTEEEELGTSTKAAFEGLGYPALCRRYGVQLVDFNDGPFDEVDFGEYRLRMARAALEADFVVNLPVLKTHNITKVSLGIKNLKGLLDYRSKKFCHHKEMPLNTFVARLGEKIPPQLTVIDGLYALERGPAMTGKAHRADLLVASREVFAADAVGTKLLGIEPSKVEHLQEYAQQRGFDPRGVSFTQVGENPEEVSMPLEWDWDWLEDNSGPTVFKRMGIEGLYYPKYDNTLCTGCSFLNNAVLILLLGAYRGDAFPGLELIGGKSALAEGKGSRSFLFGNCAVARNRNNPKIQKAVEIKGCPPSLEDITEKLNECGVPADLSAYSKYRASIADRYKENPEFKEEDFRPHGENA